MPGVLIHDGRRAAHRKWCVDAVSARFADGVILTPFSTPRVAEPRHPSAGDVSSAIRSIGGEVIFDAMTHAYFLPGANKFDFYDGWELWGPDGPVLDTTQRRLAHIERVFNRQSQVGSPSLAPTLQLSSPHGTDSVLAREMARTAQGLDSSCWQSLVGTRSFWSSGSALDAYVGSLAALHSPVWVLTMANELVVDHVPDLNDTAAFAGFCRTVHSLSLRSRVIIAYADLSGLPAIAAGADTLGSGWDRAQRTYDPNSFRVDSDTGIRIPAAYVTQGLLHSILRRDTADAVERWSQTRAAMIRGGVMPPSDQAQRMHHLSQLRAVVINMLGFADRKDRIDYLRSRYRVAGLEYDALIAALPRIVRERDKNSWQVSPWAVLETYAQAEGL